MEKQVRIGPASIPFSLYLAMIRFPETQQVPVSYTTTKLAKGTVESMEKLLANFPEDPLSLKYDGVPPEDAVFKKESYSGNMSIEDVVETWLAGKARASLKRHETFAPSDHRWRRDINSAYRGPKHMWASGWALRGSDLPSKSNYLFHISSKELNQTEPRVKEAKFWGTNQILENILYLLRESERTDYLRRVGGGNELEGADKVRAAYHLDRFHGVGRYHRTPQEKAIVEATITIISRWCKQTADLQRSIQLTDLLIECMGLEHMPELVKNYEPLYKFGCVVPKRHAYAIVSAMQTHRLRHLKGPELMQELGYKPVEVNNIPVLWYRPPAKPI